MGQTPPYPIACDENKESSSQYQTLSDESISLSSVTSIPSLPSLQLHNIHSSTLHHCISTLRCHSSYVSALALHRDSLYTGSFDEKILLWIPTATPSSQELATVAVANSKSAVKSLVISGRRLISAHHDRKIRVWEITEDSNNTHHRLRFVLPTIMDRLLGFFRPRKYVKVRRHKSCSWVWHVDAVSSLALAHDGSLLYSVSWDRSLKVWRTSNFRCLESIPGAHQDAINAVVASADGFIYTGSADTTIKVWRQSIGMHGKKTGRHKSHSLVGTLERHRSAVNALALSDDGSILYSGACDRSVLVWEGRGGLMSATGALRGHKKAVLCLAARGGDAVCSGSADRTVRVWRREKGEYYCVAVLEGHEGPVKSLAMVVKVDGDDVEWCMVYSGGMDCSVKVWKLLVHP